MPRQSRGFFACDFCGLQHDTLEEAREHELHQCSKRSTTRPPSQQATQQPGYSRHYFPQGPPPTTYFPANMGPLSSSTHHVAAAHDSTNMSYYWNPPKDRAFPLISPHVQNPMIASQDNVACQNIEVFEASPEIVAEHNAISRSTNSPSGKASPLQVGMRCIHCKNKPDSAPPTTATALYRLVFPHSVASMADHIRKVADNHLASCRLAPPEVQNACQTAAASRRGGDVGDDKDPTRAALIDYCFGFCEQVGIVNKQGHKSGLEFLSSSLSGAGGNEGSFAMSTPAGMSSYEHRMGPPPSAYFDRRGMAPVEPQPAGIAPTPLHRTRSGREEPTTAAAASYTSSSIPQNTPSSMGYPTPYTAQRHKRSGGDSNIYGGDSAMATPAQPNFEKGYPTPQTARQTPVTGGSPGGEYPEHQDPQQHYDLPSNFPFYQESNRTWHCKYCASIPPQFRDPHSIWSSSSGEPPPGNFIDSHLSMCRAYHQSGYPPGTMMYPGPGYGMPPHPIQPPFGPGGWEGAPFPYPPHDYFGHPHPSQMYPSLDPSDPNNARAAEIARFGRGYAPSQAHEQQVSEMFPVARSRVATARVGEQSGAADEEAMNQAINYLVQFEKEYYARDPANAAIPMLVLDEDHLLLTDYFFHLMRQLRLCRFGEADRKTRGGKREKIKIGYGGLQCIHCADLPMSRKFFWSNVDRLANSFAEIPGHVLKCKRCPPQCKEALLQLKVGHPDQMSKLPRGSQKVFFRRMWRRLHDGDPEDDAEAASPKAAEGTPVKAPPSPPSAIKKSPEKLTPDAKKSADTSPSSGQSEETTLVVQRSAKEAARALSKTANDLEPVAPPSPSSRVLLAIPEDKEWLSEKDCFIRKQLEVFCATKEDVDKAQADRKYPVSVGQVGIRCIHCSIALGTEAPGHATAYPFNISGINESVREFHRLHLDSCENLPAATKAKLEKLGASSLSSVLRRYYVLGAKALGLRDSKIAGIRAGGESSPIGSQAAFTFAEGDDDEDSTEEEKGKEDRNQSGDKRSSDTSGDEGEPPAKMARKAKVGEQKESL